MSWTSFARVILAKNVKLKSLLMDREVVAGIGPDLQRRDPLGGRPPPRPHLQRALVQEIRRLFRALVETLHEAVKHRGHAPCADHPFVDLYGKQGDYQDDLHVYAREGEPCRRCRAPVVKIRYSNKPLYYCEACQV